MKRTEHIRRLAVGAALAVSAFVGVDVRAEPPSVALTRCHRADHYLASFLLCLELQARRPVSTHDALYGALAELNR